MALLLPPPFSVPPSTFVSLESLSSTVGLSPAYAQPLTPSPLSVLISSRWSCRRSVVQSHRAIIVHRSSRALISWLLVWPSRSFRSSSSCAFAPILASQPTIKKPALTPRTLKYATPPDSRFSNLVCFSSPPNNFTLWPERYPLTFSFFL